MSGSQMLPIVKFDKKLSFLPKNSVILGHFCIILRHFKVKLHKKLSFLKIPDAALKFQITLWNPVYYCKFTHIHQYSGPIKTYCVIFRTLCNSCIFRTLSYSESWHIQNLRYIQNSAKVYSGIFSMLCNICILRTLPQFRILAYLRPNAYLKSCLCRHIQAYSIMIVIITFFFFHFNLTYF